MVTQARTALAGGVSTSGPGTAAAAGELAATVAWLAYDADQPDLARSLTSDALMLSRSAGNQPMVLFELSMQAMLDI